MSHGTNDREDLFATSLESLTSLENFLYRKVSSIDFFTFYRSHMISEELCVNSHRFMFERRIIPCIL